MERITLKKIKMTPNQLFDLLCQVPKSSKDYPLAEKLMEEARTLKKLHGGHTLLELKGKILNQLNKIYKTYYE